jgi:hypothetical protein
MLIQTNRAVERSVDPIHSNLPRHPIVSVFLSVATPARIGQRRWTLTSWTAAFKCYFVSAKYPFDLTAKREGLPKCLH